MVYTREVKDKNALVIKYKKNDFFSLWGPCLSPFSLTTISQPRRGDRVVPCRDLLAAILSILKGRNPEMLKVIVIGQYVVW